MVGIFESVEETKENIKKKIYNLEQVTMEICNEVNIISLGKFIPSLLEKFNILKDVM